MTDPTFRSLAETVQYNCNISDARHGADYSLCVYLMKMREYYRWEMHLPYGSVLEKEYVGNWLTAREQLWEELEGAEFKPVTVAGELFDPFDSQAINARIAPQGLVYSAGLGHGAKPHFFLGDLECMQRHGDYAVYVAADEHARDLAAPPAMIQGNTIYLRRESLRRMLWEKLESWRWARPDNALGRAFSSYDFASDLEDALDDMTDHEIRSCLLHEEGEYAAGQRLGDEDWNAMVLDLGHSSAEVFARAVRDHLADCLVTLPALVESDDIPSLHFYVGNLTAMRREIFPALVAAYGDWWEGASQCRSNTHPLATLAERGRGYWELTARDILGLYQRLGPAAAAPIAELAKSRRL